MCLSPARRKIVSSDGTVRYITYACGHCLECAHKLQRDWSMRLVEESKQWPNALFFTLKYSNSRVPIADVALTSEQVEFCSKLMKTLPANYDFNLVNDDRYDYLRPWNFPVSNDISLGYALTFDKSDIQNFWKRVRRRLELYYGHDIPLRYFVCSEYGPKTLRPHYHGILFCEIPVNVVQSIMYSVWCGIASEAGSERMCFSASPVENNEACAKYVSKYCVKPVQFEHPYVSLGILPKPFRMMSKGIGIDYANKLRSQFNSILSQYNIKQQIIDKNKHYVHNSSLFECYKLPDSFYSDVKDIFSKTVQYNGQVLKIPYPRYWRDRAFPVRYYPSKIYDTDSCTVETKFTLRKDCDHPISVGYASYVSRQIDEEFNTRYTELKVLHPQMSDSELCSLLAAQDYDDILKRERDLLSRMAKFYGKSNF